MDLVRCVWRGGEIAIDDFRGDLRIAVDPRDEMGAWILWFDAYSRAELDLVQSRLSLGDVFVDAGANIGEFTLVAARAVGPSGMVHAFEPMTPIRERLERHVAWNGFTNVAVHAEALGDQPGTISMFGPARSTAHQGLFTTLPSPERSIKMADAQQVTLDSLDLPRLDGFKLDIEGAELAALKGAYQTLKRCKPWITCEVGKDTRLDAYDPSEILSLLLGLGYALSIIEPNGTFRPIFSADDLGEWQNVLAS